MCRYFREGLASVCPIPRLFTWKELETLISGSDKPIDIEDWKSHTNYTGGYDANHPMIVHFWEVSVKRALYSAGNRHDHHRLINQLALRLLPALTRNL